MKNLINKSILLPGKRPSHCAGLISVVMMYLLTGCSTVPEAIEPGLRSGQSGEVELQGHSISNVIEVVAVGDTMMDGSAAPEMRKYGYDYPFELTKKYFSEKDVVLANLEGPLTNHRHAGVDKKYKFRSPPDKVAPALKKAGINIVTLANNHTLDYGHKGLVETLKALDESDIKYVGAGLNSRQARNGAVIETDGGKVGVLGYSLTFPEEFWASNKKSGTAFGHAEHVRADVERMKQVADVVIVTVHWGREATTELRDYQRSIGRIAIQAGASAVIGHHPHVLQGIERYKQGVIIYSLGNYVFGSYSRKATRSAIAQLTFENKRLTALQLVPINVDNVEVIFQPKPLSGDDAQKVIQEIRKLSEALNTRVESVDDVAVIDLVHDIHKSGKPDLVSR